MKATALRVAPCPWTTLVLRFLRHGHSAPPWRTRQDRIHLCGLEHKARWQRVLHAPGATFTILASTELFAMWTPSYRTTITPSNPSTSVSDAFDRLLGHSERPGPTPTGTVTFSVGDTTLCSDALTSGSASCSSSSAPLVDDAVTVSYGGDSNYSSNFDHLVDRRLPGVDLDVGDPVGQPDSAVHQRDLLGDCLGRLARVGDSGWHGRLHLERLHDRHLLGGRAEFGRGAMHHGVLERRSRGPDRRHLLRRHGLHRVGVGRIHRERLVRPVLDVAVGVPPWWPAASAVTYSATVSASLLTSPIGSVAFTIGATDLCAASLAAGRVLHRVERPPGLGRDGDGHVLGVVDLRGLLEHDDAFGDTARSIASGRRDGVKERCRRPGGTATAVTSGGGITGSGSGYGSLTVSTYGANPDLGRSLGWDRHLLRR